MTLNSSPCGLFIIIIIFFLILDKTKSFGCLQISLFFLT